MKMMDTRRGQKVEAEPGSESFQEIYRAARSSYLDPNKSSRWEICEITLLQNDELGLDFHEKKQLLLDGGRTSEEVEERYGFWAAAGPSTVDSILNEGYRIGQSWHILGNPLEGVHLCKNADVCLQHFLNAEKMAFTANIVVFKYVLGKKTSAIPRDSRVNMTRATQGFDSHVSLFSPNSNDNALNRFNKSTVFLYELDNNGMPIQRPRHCLPYAVLVYKCIGERGEILEAENVDAVMTDTSAAAATPLAPPMVHVKTEKEIEQEKKLASNPQLAAIVAAINSRAPDECPPVPKISNPPVDSKVAEIPQLKELVDKVNSRSPSGLPPAVESNPALKQLVLQINSKPWASAPPSYSSTLKDPPMPVPFPRGPPGPPPAWKKPGVGMPNPVGPGLKGAYRPFPPGPGGFQKDRYSNWFTETGTSGGGYKKTGGYPAGMYDTPAGMKAGGGFGDLSNYGEYDYTSDSAGRYGGPSSSSFYGSAKDRYSTTPDYDFSMPPPGKKYAGLKSPLGGSTAYEDLQSSYGGLGRNFGTSAATGKYGGQSNAKNYTGMKNSYGGLGVPGYMGSYSTDDSYSCAYSQQMDPLGFGSGMGASALGNGSSYKRTVTPERLYSEWSKKPRN